MLPVAGTTGAVVSAGFELSRSDRDGVAVLTVSGELDLATTPQLREAMDTALAAADTVLDMRQVSFVDSSVVGALTGAYRASRQTGRQLIIAGAGGQAHDVLTLTRMDSILTLCPDLTSALALAMTHCGLGHALCP